jgi:uncharacterized protein (TIGR01777 family)
MKEAYEKRVVIAGGNGFIGRALVKELRAREYKVVVLTRKRRWRNDGVEEVEYSPGTIGEWIKHLDRAAAVVNLAGRNINCPHTPENLREILESRVTSVNNIAMAIDHTPRPPRVWVQAGAIGYYGDREDVLCDEDSPAGNDPLAEICVAWEKAFYCAPAPKTRRVLLRIGMALGRDGGALPALDRLTTWFLGGSFGDGRQYMSWISLADLTRAFIAAIEREDFSGTFNAVAPNPMTNNDFMGDLRRVLQRPWCPPAPEWAIHIGARLLKTEPSLALTSCRCAPKRLLASGFTFEYPDLLSALKKLHE